MIRAYEKGVRKERAVVNEARAEGHIAFRSAGSHSPIDVCIVNTDRNIIYLIQCKPDNFPESAKNRLYREFKKLNGQFQVWFLVR